MITIEPAAAMREVGQRTHPDTRIRSMDDRLPALKAERSQTFRKSITLLKPDKLLSIPLHHGSAEADRKIYEMTWEEIEF